MNKKSIIYIDISQFLKNRFQTGIQRVIKEFLFQALENNLNFKILYFYEERYFTLSMDELKSFLLNIKGFEISSNNQINIFKKDNQKKVFLEIDSIWNEEINLRINLYSKLKELNFTIINFIYDLIPIKFPYLMRENTRKNFLPYIQAINLYSDKVIFDSNSARNDFMELFKNNYTSDLKLEVVYLGSNFNSLNSYINSNFYHFPFLDKKYILFVATIEPRKRHDIVLEAFEELQKNYKDLNLVFVGTFGWKVSLLEEKIKNHFLKGLTFFHLENINDNQLEFLYKKAFIVTYISDYEGFGLPIAESLYYNNITIVSNNSSIKEVGESYVDYTKENNSENLVKTINMYMQDEEKYNKRKEYLKKNYKINTWNNFYKKIIELI